MSELPTLDTDVLVVGGGLAGIRAALAAHDRGARVLLATVRPIGEGGSSFYPLSLPWGLLFAAGDDADRRSFLDDVLTAGAGCLDPALAALLVDRSAEAYGDLLSYGVPLRSLAELGDVPCIGTRPRGARLGSLREARDRLRKQVGRRGFPVFEDLCVYDLLVEEGKCHGALARSRGSTDVAIAAGAVVLATGGAEALWTRSFSRGDTDGSGYAMAARRGARLVNLEFIQFIPGLVAPIAGVNFHHKSLGTHPLLTDAVGEKLLSRVLPEGLREQDCLDSRSRHGPFSSEDVSRFFDIALARAGASPESAARIAYGASLFADPEQQDWRQYLADLGLDPRTTPLAVYPHCQAFNGGVRIDEGAQTDIGRLFACGECAGGPHGADRVGGTAILGALVFGKIAGESAAAAARSAPRRPLSTLLPDRPPPLPIAEPSPATLGAIRRHMQEAAFIERREAGLAAALRSLGVEELPFLDQPSPTRNRFDAARLILASMLERRESRGGHYRVDHPPVSRTEKRRPGEPSCVTMSSEGRITSCSR